MDICQRILHARPGGELIVRIEAADAASPGEVARRFGLADVPGAYVEIDAAEARSVLAAVLAEDMAYGSPLMPRAAAEHLAREFIGLFGREQVRFYTNGEWGRPRAAPHLGPGWVPVTDATFDTGVLVLAPGRIGCAWFMDED